MQTTINQVIFEVPLVPMESEDFSRKVDFLLSKDLPIDPAKVSILVPSDYSSLYIEGSFTYFVKYTNLSMRLQMCEEYRSEQSCAKDAEKQEFFGSLGGLYVMIDHLQLDMQDQQDPFTTQL